MILECIKVSFWEIGPSVGLLAKMWWKGWHRNPLPRVNTVQKWYNLNDSLRRNASWVMQQLYKVKELQYPWAVYVPLWTQKLKLIRPHTLLRVYDANNRITIINLQDTIQHNTVTDTRRDKKEQICYCKVVWACCGCRIIKCVVQPVSESVPETYIKHENSSNRMWQDKLFHTGTY